MSQYQPNFNNPRVRDRSLTAIGFVCGVMSHTKPREWSTRYIDKYLGNQRNDLSKYLRELLLICTDDRYSFNKGERSICKKYILNQEGLQYLRGKLNLNNITTYPIVVKVAKDDHLNELTTGSFVYNDQSNRLWHPLQRYRREHKRQILADHGYQHQYDIECCAPTLIHQYSQQQTDPMDLYLSALTRYLKEKNQVRQQLSAELELPIDAVKEIINALFAGAVISRNTRTDIYHILNGDLARIEFLKQNQFIQELVTDIKTCWQYLQPVIAKRTKKTKKGTERRLPVTSKQKWQVYFELERRVLNSIRDYLEEKQAKYFLEHDGWSCNEEINQIELRDYVKEQTGFVLKFDYKKIAVQ
jgi:hypothetical protein